MSLYNMLFGMNNQSGLLLAVIGLKQVDVERFRDCDASEDGSKITVYSRTGGGNREYYPNLLMRKRPEWIGSEDDDFDSTYCTDTFEVPQKWRKDVAGLSDLLKNGLRGPFARHLAATINREPSAADKERSAHDSEAQKIARTDHMMANGHTFVPKTDGAAKIALELAESNNGSLRSCWGIMPLMITVKQNTIPYPNAKDEELSKSINRITVSYEWKIDKEYWQHMQERWLHRFPLTMAKIKASVDEYLSREKK